MVRSPEVLRLTRLRNSGCLVPLLFAVALVLVLPLGRPGAPLMVGLLLYLFAGLLAWRALRRQEGPRWWDLPPASPRRWDLPPASPRQWAWALLIVPVLIFEAAGLQLLLAAAWELSPELADGFLEFMAGLEGPESGGWLGLEILLGVLLAPVVEEVLFRKLLLERWIRRMGPTKAILAQAALFGALHLLLVGAFVFGVFAALIYLRTRSIWVPAAFHILNNGLGWIVWAVVAPGVWFGSMPDIRDAAPTSALITAVSAVLLIWLAVRLWPERPNPQAPPPE